MDLKETEDSSVGFFVPDSQEDENFQQACNLITGLTTSKLQKPLVQENLFLEASNTSSQDKMADRKTNINFHFSSTNESEVEDQDNLLAVDTVSDNYDSRNESDRNVTVVERVTNRKDIKHTENSLISTPAQKIRSLQFSGEPVFEQETLGTFNEVSPTPDAFDSILMIIPDSPCNDEEKDEEDEEITFRMADPTVNSDYQSASAEKSEARSVSESQSFHLKLTPSQADVLETSDAEDVPAENIIGKNSILPSELRQDFQSVLETSKPLSSFPLQKSSSAVKEVESVEGSEESISVFRRVRSVNTTPQKHQRIMDDSDDFVPIAGLSNLNTKRDLEFPTEDLQKSTAAAFSKDSSSKKWRKKCSDKDDDHKFIRTYSTSKKKHDRIENREIVLEDSEEVHTKKTSVHEIKTCEKMQYASLDYTAPSVVTTLEDPSCKNVSEDLTLSYDYTAAERSPSPSHDQSATVVAEIEKQADSNSGHLMQPSSKPQLQEKQPSIDHLREQKESLVECSDQKEPSRNLNSKFSNPEQHLSQEISVSEKRSSRAVKPHSKTLLLSTSKVSVTSIKHEKLLCGSQEAENIVSKDPGDFSERRKISHSHSRIGKTGLGMHENTFTTNAGARSELSGIAGRIPDSTDVARDTSTSFSKTVIHRKPESADPYTFLGSQSQTFSNVSHPALSSRSHTATSRGRKRSVKFMKKTLRKRVKSKQEGYKSSSTDNNTKSNINKKRPKLRGKNLKQKLKPDKIEQVKGDLSQKQLIQVPQVSKQSMTESSAFTSLQEKAKFNKPLAPPIERASPSSLNGLAEKTQQVNKNGQTIASKKQMGKSVTVSLSGSGEGQPSVSRDFSDSSEHESERIIVQRVMTGVLIFTEVTKTEVFNSKGQVTRQTETSVEVERITLDPKITSEKVTERIILPVLSPSRTVSTVTTGDLADISSSSLSKMYSSESKTSNPSVSPSQSLPTPAQRQHSMEGIDNGKLQQKGGNQQDSDPVDPGGVAIIVSKFEQKRVSFGSNSDRDLWSTPNQSIIDHADSHIGKVVSSSHSTPNSLSLISPNTAGNKPDPDKSKTTSPQKTGIIRTLHVAGNLTTSSRLPIATSEKSAVTTLVYEQTGQIIDTTQDTKTQVKDISPGKGKYSHGNSETHQRQNTRQSLEEQRLISDSDHIHDDDVEESKLHSKRRKVSDHDNNNLRSDHQKQSAGKMLASKSKDYAGESTDIQSTGFSVHGIPPSTGSGASSKDHDLTGSSKSSAVFSSEISFQGKTVKIPAQMVILKDYKSKPVIGAKVMGKWKDGYYYPGILSKVDQNSKKYIVKYDDGSQSAVKANEIILAGELPIGQSVMVLTKDDFYEPGMVMGHSESRGDDGAVHLMYHVERDDGVTQMCERRSLILSDGQAACLLSDEEMRISPDAYTPSASKPADISLDNLVEGKRQPRAKRSVVNKDNEPSTSGLQTTSAAAVVSSTESDSCHSGRKRKLGPVATSTPTPKQVCKESRQRASATKNPNPLGSAVLSPRKISWKARTGLVFEPFIPKKSNLFEGYVFMLTHVRKSSEEKAQEKMLLEGSSLETSAEDNIDMESEATPFVEEQLQAIIEAGGGQVIDLFDEIKIQAAKHCYLVAAEHQRTVKYLQALAAGLTIVSHLWVLHSAEQNKLQGLKAYILPAGISLEKKKLIEGIKGCSELARQTIMVVSTNEEFINVWTSILKIAHSHVVTRFPARASKNDPGVDVVVSDTTCPPNIVRRCQQLDVPLVSSEWIAQCLITGHLVDVKGNEKYKHDFTV